MVKSISLSSAAINSLTTGDSSILYNNQTRDIVLYGGSIGFAESSVFNLEINNINGECLTLKHNSSTTNYTNFNVSSTGQLNIITNGTDRIVNIDGHNGSSRGLSLGGTLITASANELNVLDGITATTTKLNYVDTTPGIAEASKALIMNENRDITNIHNIQTENLTVNGTLVTSSATELNYNDIATIGIAEAGKALVINVDKDISEIRNLSATNLTGTLQTASQPNITEVGTITSLSADSLTIDGTLLSATATEINTLSGLTVSTAELNKLSGVTSSTTELNYVDTTPGTAVASKALVVDANRDISNIHNIQTENLTVNGTLVTSSATELNYNDITTIGTAEPGKALVVSVDKDISGIRNLSATNLSGTIQTSSQPNINALGTITSLSAGSITLDGGLITASAAELNKLDGVTTITSELNILNGLTATTAELNTLDGIVATTAELNILNGVTAVYTELNVLDGITSTTAELNILDGVTATATELNYNDLTTGPGTADASKTLVVDSNKDIGSIRNLSVTGSITGTLATAAQYNITSIGTLTGVTSSGAVSITDTTASTTASTGALKVSGGVGIGGDVNITGYTTIGGALTVTGNINGTISTTTQGNITSLGTLTGLTSSGIISITNNTASISTTSGALKIIGGVGIGGALNVGGALSVTGNITGTLATVSQPNITTLAGVTSIGASSSTTLTGTLQTATQENITSVGTLTGLTSSGAVSITNNTASTSTTTGALKIIGGVGIGGALNVGGNLILGGTTLTSSSFNSISGVTAGTAAASKALILDANGEIRNISYMVATYGFSAPYLWGTLQTGAQGNITSVGTLGSLTVGGGRTSIYSSLSVTGPPNNYYPIYAAEGVNVYVGSGHRLIANAAGSWSGGTILVSIYGRWNMQSDGYYVSSDRRLKTEISYISTSKALKILNITPCNFTWKGSDIKDFGVIAQDLIKEDLGDLVKLVKSDRVHEECAETGAPAESQFLVDYEKIGLYVLEVVKKQNNEITELKEKNAQLENTIQSILARISNLEN
jgi:hypothetical protein